MEKSNQFALHILTVLEVLESDGLQTNTPSIYEDFEGWLDPLPDIRECLVYELLDVATHLVGHEVKDAMDCSQWIMSSSKGQVVFPALYESQTVERDGLLTLTWYPGVLRYERDIFNRVIAGLASNHESRKHFFNPKSNISLPADVTVACNSFQGWKVAWMVSVSESALKLQVGLENPEGEIAHKVYPGPILEYLSSVFFIDHCRHGRNTPLSTPDKFSRYGSPMELHEDDITDTTSIAIIPVAGAEDLRFYTLCALSVGEFPGPHQTLLAGNACIACCLNHCRELGCQVLIL
ncbi:hypothetical protein F4777DRAFT_573621 [Nemania sp. FL0916]|nr:hypothetical protein F4777DRAFT_573621 [Nemania sp. FL0916]